MTYKFKLRRGPASEWTADNPVLLAGEPGFEIDTNKLKIGDGVQAWNSLDYFPNAEDLVAGVASVDGREGVVVLGDLYSELVHAHAQSDITGLVSALAGKAATSHAHTESDVTGLTADLAAKAASVHSHAESDVTGLTADLAGKASSVHTHAESDVTGLTADLAGKAASVHSHAESDVTGLTADLAGKASSVHAHAQSDVTGLSSALSGKSDTGHGHAQSDITGLVSSLAGKSDTGHTHAQSDVTGLSSALAGKSDTSHNHVSGPAPVTLTPGSTVATDASLGTYFRLTPTTDFTLSNPTNMVDGQRVLWEITQGTGGSHLITLGTAFIFGTDLTSVTLSTTVDKKDFIGAVYNSGLGKWLVLAFTKGF